jgi:diguanylate cyclase (GGDEF)-like protein
MARPRRLLRFGIRQKVVLVLLVVLLTALSVSGWLVLRDVERNVLSETQRRGVEMAEYLSRSLAYSVVGYDYHTIQLLLDQIVQAGDVVHVRVLSDRGNTMAEAQHPDRTGVERVSFDRSIEPDLAMFRRHGEPGSLLVMDMDRFKTINDNYGHDVGDLILCQFAELPVQHLRETDTVCRLGGEEFAVFLRRTDGPTAMRIAEKLRREVEEMNVELDDGIRVPVTVSIGVALPSAELRVTTDVTLYKAADSAMYISKQTGRNRVTHYAGLEVNAAAEPAGEANP